MTDQKAAERPADSDAPQRVLAVVVERDVLDGGFVSSSPDAPGCVSQGDTVVDALTGFADAYVDWAIARALRGMEVPRC